MSRIGTLIGEVRQALEDYEIPDPPASHEYEGVKYHEVAGPGGEHLLLAFGLVPLAVWLRVVNAYHVEHADEVDPWDPTDPDKVMLALTRLCYQRVTYVPEEDGRVEILWHAEGITPVTLWIVR